jgi:deoxycytidine triphosphate deaminase
MDTPHGEATGMIEPLRTGQIKERDGKRIVSYGTSSYGYDIRCADEFKLFTNINTTIVDPKISTRTTRRRVRQGLLHHSAELVRAGPHGRVFPHPATC